MIIVSKVHLSNIQSHGVLDYPHECCGALLGSLDAKTGEKKVALTVPIENQWKDDGDETKTRRFAVTSDDYRQAEKKAADAGVSLLGFYHSHPDHPPKPSETDLKYAWPVFSYIIFSVQKAGAKELYSYTLNLDSGVFESEDVWVID